MPTYQYACTECGHGFEAVQSFSDDALTTCPECAGRLRKVFNAVGVVFKGSGFYRTDSRKETEGAAQGESTKPTKGEPAAGKAAETAGSLAGGAASAKSPKSPKSPQSPKSSEGSAA